MILIHRYSANMTQVQGHAMRRVPHSITQLLPGVHTQPASRMFWSTIGGGGQGSGNANDYVVDPLLQHSSPPPPHPTSISPGTDQLPYPSTTTTTSNNSSSRAHHHKLSTIALLSPGSTLTHKAAKQRASSPPPSPHLLSSSSQPCVSTIVCSECGKCRCDACTKPRTLPQATLCEGRVTCSADAVIEMCTCVTAARYIFYYSLGCDANEESLPEGDVTGYDDEDQGYYDAVAVRDGVARQPCACSGQPYCCQRWTCLLSGALICPCLCLYWPLTGCSRLVECLHDRCRRRGCRCKASDSSSFLESSINSQRPLLDLDPTRVITSCPPALQPNGNLDFSWPSRTWREERGSTEDEDHVVVNRLSSSAPPAVPPRTPPLQGQGHDQAGLGPASVVRRPRAPSPASHNDLRLHHPHPHLRLLSASIDQETGEVVTSLVASSPCPPLPPPVVPPRSRTRSLTLLRNNALNQHRDDFRPSKDASGNDIAHSAPAVDEIEPIDFRVIVPPPLPPKQRAASSQQQRHHRLAAVPTPSSSPLNVVHSQHNHNNRHLNNSSATINSNTGSLNDLQSPHQLQHQQQQQQQAPPPLPAKMQSLRH